jgi:hypothetical protein
MVETQAERRRFPRLRVENPVLVTKLNPSDSPGFAKLEVLGLGGCQFLFKAPVGEGTFVELVISAHERLVKALGRVVHEVRVAPSTFEVGVEFTDIAPADLEALRSVFEEDTD